MNGNQVINSTNKTINIPFNLIVNTNNRTGYTAYISTETNETALKNNDPDIHTEIVSISTSTTLEDFSINNWGYRLNSESNYHPISGISHPKLFSKTATKTNGSETIKLNIGMKLNESLPNGTYSNKLVFSVVSNYSESKAVMTNGPDFNTRVGRLDVNQTYEDEFGNKDHIYSIKRSLLNADLVPTNAINIEDELESEFQIKAWFDLAKKPFIFGRKLRI